MNNKQLIITNTLWYKIRNLFSKIFIKKNEKTEDIQSVKDNDFTDNISYRDRIIISSKQKEVADAIMKGNKKIELLSDNEVKDMIEYFIKYNRKMNQDIERIRKNIINLRNNINN